MKKSYIQPDDEERESEVEFYMSGEPGLPPLPLEVAKTKATFLLDRDVAEYYQSTGEGWQERLNDDLRKNFR